ncbi:MAG TPA: tripartite tricarboxylate transporter substrate-binding protein, partial [Blastocatellia bacterium]|nr:tripartite tricarboxylate transporter substrate-binding protein [Blastocatellia bacterium]
RSRTEYNDQLPNKIRRRVLLKGLGVAAGAALFPSGCHQATSRRGCPQVAGRQLRWLVPFTAGGGYDIYSRLIQPFYAEKLGANIVVENMPGAGGTMCANTLSQSKPDGLTLGFFNAPGLLAAAMAEGSAVPNPATEMTVLGRVARSRMVWIASESSRLRTIEDTLLESQKRRIVFAISEVGSTNFICVVVGTSLLEMKMEFVSGYAGSRETMLGLLRGEADLMSATFESVVNQIESGDVRPILQIDSERIAAHPSLEGVPFLCGDSGLAAGRASALGRAREQITADAGLLADFLGTGLVVVAPPRLEKDLFECLEERLHEALTDSGFRAAAAEARRSLDVARAAETQREIATAATEVQRFIPAMQESINKLRRR